MTDPFNCPKCGSHDYGLALSHGFIECPHCLLKDRNHLRAKVAYYEALVPQLQENISDADEALAAVIRDLAAGYSAQKLALDVALAYRDKLVKRAITPEGAR